MSILRSRRRPSQGAQATTARLLPDSICNDRTLSVLTRMLRGVLFGVAPLDPVAFAATSLLLTLVALCCDALAGAADRMMMGMGRSLAIS